MNHRPIILSLTSMHEAGLRILRERPSCAWPARSIRRRSQREVVGADGLIIRTGGVVDAALLDRGDKLKVVGRHGVGYDQIDVDAATARGIQVVYTPGANTQSVAEHVFALMIGLSRHFPRMMAGLAGGQLSRPNQHDRPRDRRQDLGDHRLRTDRPPRGRDRPSRVRDEGALPRHRARARGGRAALPTPAGPACARFSKSPNTSRCTSRSTRARGHDQPRDAGARCAPTRS